MHTIPNSVSRVLPRAFAHIPLASPRLIPRDKVEASIEALWQEQLSKNPLLFNGSKFRLAGYSTEGDHTSVAAAAAAVSSDAAESSSEGGRKTPPPPPRSRSPTSPPTRKLRLRLGLTDYRTFRGEWGRAGSSRVELSLVWRVLGGELCGGGWVAFVLVVRGQVDRQTDRQTERQAGRQASRQACGQTGRLRTGRLSGNQAGFKAGF